jgi:hypothetical protein
MVISSVRPTNGGVNAASVQQVAGDEWQGEARQQFNQFIRSA